MPRGAVEPGEHRVLLVALPVRARDLGELDGLHAPGGRDVRALAEVGEVAVGVDRRGRVLDVLGDGLDLVALPGLLHEREDLVLGRSLRSNG
jgi:hypothetical protein